MPATGILIGHNLHFPRSYITGFVGSSGMGGMVIVGDQIYFQYLPPVYEVYLRINPKFYQVSSNSYTLDYVFDFGGSQVYQSGVPIVAGIGYKFVAMTTEPTWRIQVLATLAIDETNKLDLAQPANYWRPMV